MASPLDHHAPSGPPPQVPIAFIGAGRVAATLAQAMQLAGLHVAAISSRDQRHAEAIAATVPGAVAATVQGAADAGELVFVTVSDDAIERVCAAVVWRPGQSVVHCSGASDLDVLREAKLAGALVGAFHPMQMFANPLVARERLPGCTITIAADPPLDALLDDVGRRLGCRMLRLPAGRRALYHASANYVGPFVIALMQEAVTIWRALGVPERDALAALVPLVEGTLAAVKDGGLAHGMGGCVARGDVGTVERHLDALEAFSPESALLYRHMTVRTIPLGLARGTLSVAAAKRIRLVLDART